jgi:beta-lactamase regulating signal transducer with metallopeptidase domain
MILRADGHPVRRRHSVGFAGSFLFHVVLATAVLSLYQAGVTQPASPPDDAGGSGRSTRGHSSAVVGASQFGGEPTGTAMPGEIGAMPMAAEASWPVRQAERLGLRLGIGWVIDHLWQSTLFAMVIGLLTLAFRRNRARVRYALWLSASVKFLVPFSVVMWIGSIIGSSALAVLAFFGAFFGVSSPLGTAGPLGSSGSLRAFTDASLSFLQDLVQHPLIGGFGQWLTATGTLALWPSTFTVDEVAAAWLALALLGIWTWGFFAIVAYRFRLSRQLWDVALTSRRVELLDVKVPARLQVGLTEGLLEPGVIGWFNPVLLLPADIERHLTRPEIEAIVAHELCHVRRFDNMTAAIHMLVEALFWFHPLVWWLGARLVDERERACDEHVLSSVGAPGPYAQGILNICKRYVESPLASVSGVGSANVRERIDAILANQIGEATSPWKKVMLSGIILCVLIVPLAAGALQAPPPRQAPPRGTTSVGVPAVTTYALVVAHADGHLGPELKRTGTGAAGPDAGAPDAAGGADAPGTSGASRASRASVVRASDAIVRPREISADAMTLPRLSALLASIIGRDVEDRTGLTGDFTIRLTWTSDPSGPSLSAALEQQLGLRLVQLPVQE